MSELLQHLLGNKFTRIGGAHDALSARILEDDGFDAIWASGLGISTVHGYPDDGTLSFGELLEASRRIGAAVSIPVLLDFDTGFGGQLRLTRRTRLPKVAGVCIEDKDVHSNSFDNRPLKLASIKEMCRRITAAREVAPLVVGRVESFIAGEPVHDAVDRAAAYVDAGARALAIHTRDPEAGDIRAFAARWLGTTPWMPIAIACRRVLESEWIQMGAAGVIRPNEMLRSSIRGMKNFCSGADLHLPPMSDVFALQEPR